MATVDESLATLDELFEIPNPKVLPLLKKAHKLILSIHPDVVIVPRLGEKSICYGVGPKKMSESYCYLIPFKDYLNLGFFHGTAIDPADVLEGTGAKMRHIKIHSAKDLESPKVAKFIKAALAERKKALAS